MKVLVTGSEGFIGKNLRLHLAERKEIEVVCFDAQHNIAQLPEIMDEVDFVFHLAGVNRPKDPKEFITGNQDLARALCNIVCAIAESTSRKIPVLLSSSIQADGDSSYGLSKRGAEDAVFSAMRSHGIPGHLFRLPNVFGKWCRPNYNSAVATFCYNIARDLPIQIHDPSASVTLVHIDNVIERFIQLMDGADSAVNDRGFEIVSPQYTTTVGELVQLIRTFKESRKTLITERVGNGMIRALYSTYVSYLPQEDFAYTVPQHSDHRGVFVEMLKTPDCGQFSYFTAYPGITRGGHYHHSKTEKFLVIKGKAKFRFRHLITAETVELITSGDKPQVVDTVPGWSHDITNIGHDEMVVMLWANEIFDRDHSDTISSQV